MTTDIGRAAAIRRLDTEDASNLLTGTDDQPPISSNSDAKVTVYSMTDGEPKEILKLDRTRVLDKVLADGTPAFWIEGMPGKPPEYVRGDVKCMLHPDFDETSGPAGFGREFVDRVGLRNIYCNGNNPDKANVATFKTVFDRDEHMRMKHRRSWRAIEGALERQERDRERGEQRQATEAMLAMAGRPPVADKAAEAAPVAAEKELCDVCAESFGNLSVHKQLKTDAAHKAARGE